MISKKSYKNSNPVNGDTYYHKINGSYLVWDSKKNNWISCALSKTFESKVKNLVYEFEKDNELYNAVMLEFRKKKIKKLQNNG